MLQPYFYNKTIRNSVALFGRLFNDIYITQKDNTGKTTSQQRVPLAYAPARKFLERIREQQSLETDQKIAVKLPRMSFEILTIAYDLPRQNSKVNSVNVGSTVDGNRRRIYSGVPYTLNFQLNVYAKNQDDALQIVEQIIPYFAPQYTPTIKPFPDNPEISIDVPITLQGISFSDDYEAPVEQRRMIIYTLDFEMKVLFFHGSYDGAIIREINIDLYTSNQGNLDSDLLASNINIVPDPLDVSPDSDFGFTTTITNYVDSG